MHGRARLRNLDIIPYMNHLTGYWSLLYQIPVGLIGLSFMVFVHELGHFLAAKWSGVKVHTFSIGFGKKIVRFKRGDTEYCLSVIPFGGYVAMAGENPDEGGYGNTDEFRMKPIPIRLFIAVAGPAANLIFAVFILFCLYLTGVQEPKRAMIVGHIEKNSAAEKAGVRVGDEIVAFNGKASRDWENFLQVAAMEGGRTGPLVIRRSGVFRRGVASGVLGTGTDRWFHHKIPIGKQWRDTHIGKDRRDGRYAARTEIGQIVLISIGQNQVDAIQNSREGLHPRAKQRHARGVVPRRANHDKVG